MPSVILFFSCCAMARSPTKLDGASNTSWTWKKRASPTAAKPAAAGFSIGFRDSERPLAFHRHAGARARVRPVIPHRAVLRTTIVPERDRIFGPSETALEPRIFRMLVKIRQNGIAFIAWNADNMAGEAAIHIESFFPGYRMRPDHRMLRAWISWLVRNAGTRIKTAIHGFTVVAGGQAVEIGFHPIRQGVIGRIHAGEQGIAATRWTLPDVQNAAHRRLQIA